MSALRVLIFGGTSQIGLALSKVRMPGTWIIDVPESSSYDFRRPSTIGKTIQDFRPDLVVNSASLTDIDFCEQNVDIATEINFHAVANLAAQCSTLDAPLIHISSDQVFDGLDGGTPYEPDAPMNPLNLFGQTMMMGEEAVRHALHWHVILRVSSVFSAAPDGPLSRLFAALQSRDPVLLASNSVASPTSANTIAQAIVIIGDAILNGKANGFGTFHAANFDPASPFDFAQKALELARVPEEDRALLSSFTAAEAPGTVPRPVYSALSASKLQSVYGIATRPWLEELRQDLLALLPP